jgi:hypothetical protein
MMIRTERPKRDLVLRRYPSGDDAARREELVLTALDGLDGWAPRILDSDPDGHRFGEPATLITRLPGRGRHSRASWTGPARRWRRGASM